MADKLDWLNQHFVLLLHSQVESVVLNENYKLPFEFKDLAKNCPLSEDFIKKLAVDQKYKEASEFLSYNLHHRALAWWAYCCVLSLRKELALNPAQEIDIESIGKPKPFDIPDWAKEPPKRTISPEDQKILDDLYKKLDEYKALNEKALKLVDPEIMQAHQEIQDIVYGEFKKIYGKNPQEMLQDALNELEKAKDSDSFFDIENSPIVKAERELSEKIEGIRQNTIKTIKSALPKKSKEELKLQTDSAIKASLGYVIAPTDENSKKCMDLGNACPDTPEGLLSLVCFWSYGNLMPMSNQVVKTPAGLAANGFNSLLLMCALAKGGRRNFDERVHHYFNIGKEVAFGINNWSEHMTDKHLEPDALTTGFSGSENDNSIKDESLEKKKEPVEFKRFKGFN